MSYSEENDQVVLRMSVEDYERVLMICGIAAGLSVRTGRNLMFTESQIADLLNRLNEGNPNYTPYAAFAERESHMATDLPSAAELAAELYEMLIEDGYSDENIVIQTLDELLDCLPKEE